jgi:cytoskeletal protein CcmA (bactofilin family)
MNHSTHSGSTNRLLAILTVALLLASALAWAQQNAEYEVPAGKTVEGNVVTIDKTVQVRGKVNGSVFATRGEVRLYDGCEVTGDVIVSGGKLKREDGAKVGGSVMVIPAGQKPAAAQPAAPEPPTPPQPSEAPQMPKIQSGDIVRYGGPVTIGPNEIVQGDVASFGGPVTVKGEVRGDVTAFGGPIKISGKVTGDVVATGGPLSLEDGAVVNGDAVAIGAPLHQGANVTVRGSTNSLGSPLAQLPRVVLGASPTGPSIFGKSGHAILSPIGHAFAWVFTTVTMLLLAGLVTLVAPRPANTVATKIEEEPLRVAFFGLVGWLLLLPLLFVLVILIITWILIPFFLLGFAVLLLLGCVGACLYGGRRLAHLLNWRVSSPVALTVIGLVALRLAGLVSILPLGEVLVGLLIATLLVMSLGGALMTRFGTDPTGMWLGRRFNHNHRAPAPQPAPPSPSPQPSPPRYSAHDLDDKTLEALSELPPDEGEPDTPGPAAQGPTDG